MITNYVINCGYKHNTFKNEIFLLDKNIKLKYQAEGLNVSVYSTTDNIDRIYFNEIEYSQNENDYGKYRFENNLTITFYENPNISFYDIIKKIVIKDYYLILKDYKNNYFLVNADNGYDLTYSINVSDNSEEINTLTIEIKSVSNHPLMIFNDFKFNIINFSEKPCDYIDNSISSIKWSLANNIFFDKEVGIKINDLSKLYNIDYLEDSFTFEEELNDNGSIITNIKLNIPLDNNQFSFSYNLLEYNDNRYKMFFITKNGNLYFTSGKLSVRYDITSNNDSEINYVTLTFSSTNNMFNSGGNGDFIDNNGNVIIWVKTDNITCDGYDSYIQYRKYILNDNNLIATDEYKNGGLYEKNSCDCGYFEFGEWYEGNNEFNCGSELGDGYVSTSKYEKWYQDKVCGGNILEEKVNSEWREYEVNSCECGYYDSFSNWFPNGQPICGSDLGDGYDSNSLYFERIRYGICNGEINYDIQFTEYTIIEGVTCEDCPNPSISDWIATDEFNCGSELGNGYVSTSKYQKYEKYLICDGTQTSTVIGEKWEVYEENSSDCLYPPIYKYEFYQKICGKENLPEGTEIVEEIQENNM